MLHASQKLNGFWPRYHGAFKNLKSDVLNSIIEYHKIDELITSEKQISISDEDIAIRIGASKTNDIPLNKIKRSDLDLYFLRAVVMESMILDMAKILGVNNNDQTGLKRLRQELKEPKYKFILEEIVDFEDKYKQEIIKIKDNRNKLIGHLELNGKKPFFDMRLSPARFEEVNVISDFEIEDTYGTREEYERVISNEKDKYISNQKQDQRYSTIDLREDIPIFKGMLNDLNTIYLKIQKVTYPPPLIAVRK